MSAIASTPIDAEAKNAPTPGRLFFLGPQRWPHTVCQP
jgi:hypothetical protein